MARKKIIYLFLILLMASFFSCSQKNEMETGSDSLDINTSELPSQVITRFTLKETVDGITKWKLNARSASVYEKKEKIIVDSVYINFYKSDGSHYSTLTAETGIIYQDSNDMEAIGDVVIKTERGEILETEKINWDNRFNRIYSDKYVKVTRDDDILTGVGFQTDPNLKHVEVKKDVQVYMKED